MRKKIKKHGNVVQGIKVMDIGTITKTDDNRIMQPISLQIGRDFKKEVEEIKQYIIELKGLCDEFDKNNPSQEARDSFVDEKKEEAFDRIMKHFSKAWQKIIKLDKSSYTLYRKYYQNNLLPFFGYPEINAHIYNKPLGYAGDFITMNYIYDYNDKYLGESSFEKLINRLTCSIPISRSNLKRRVYLKETIKEALKEKGEEVKITSIASGPARELLDLLESGEITRNIYFNCFDFEEKVFEYIKSRIRSMEGNGPIKNLKLIRGNIVDLIRKKDTRDKMQGQDLIYAFGIYDYLSDLLATKLTRALFDCLNQNGKLIICNSSSVKTDQRAYYEFLGEWEMIYRTNDELLKFSDGIPAKNVSLKDDKDDCYLYMIIEK